MGATPTFRAHLEVLGILFIVFGKVGLRIKREKCRFCVSEMKYLGFIIGGNELHPDPEKLRAIENYPEPTEHETTQTVLGNGKLEPTSPEDGCENLGSTHINHQ